MSKRHTFPHEAESRGAVFVPHLGMMLALTVAWISLGCGTSGPTPKTCYPVSGQLFVADQPAAGATIYFQPQDGGKPEDWSSGYPRAKVAADGAFQVSTHGENDGAPAGEYQLLVEWRAATAGDDGGEPAEGAASTDRLEGRFMDPETSQLQATVQPQATTLPRIDLR